MQDEAPSSDKQVDPTGDPQVRKNSNQSLQSVRFTYSNPSAMPQIQSPSNQAAPAMMLSKAEHATNQTPQITRNGAESILKAAGGGSSRQQDSIKLESIKTPDDYFAPSAFAVGGGPMTLVNKAALISQHSTITHVPKTDAISLPQVVVGKQSPSLQDNQTQQHMTKALTLLGANNSATIFPPTIVASPTERSVAMTSPNHEDDYVPSGLNALIAQSSTNSGFTKPGGRLAGAKMRSSQHQQSQSTSSQPGAKKNHQTLNNLFLSASNQSNLHKQQAKLKAGLQVGDQSRHQNQQSPLHQASLDSRSKHNGSTVSNRVHGQNPKTNSSAIKQSKTRNNLHSHVVSTGPKTRQAIVGQPYVNFKNQPQNNSQANNGAGSTGFNLANPSIVPNTLLAEASIERANQVYAKHHTNVAQTRQMQQQARASRMARDQANVGVIASSQSISDLNTQSISELPVGIKKQLKRRQLPGHGSKSSFSQSSSQRAETLVMPQSEVSGGLKYPKLNTALIKKHESSSLSSGVRLNERRNKKDLGSQNQVISVITAANSMTLQASSGQVTHKNSTGFFGGPIQNQPKARHQKSSWNLGQQSSQQQQVQTQQQQPSKQAYHRTGKASPYMARVKRNHQKQAARSNDSFEVGSLVEIASHKQQHPIAIFDQEHQSKQSHVKMPSIASVLAQGETNRQIFATSKTSTGQRDQSEDLREAQESYETSQINLASPHAGVSGSAAISDMRVLETNLASGSTRIFSQQKFSMATPTVHQTVKILSPRTDDEPRTGLAHQISNLQSQSSALIIAENPNDKEIIAMMEANESQIEMVDNDSLSRGNSMMELTLRISPGRKGQNPTQKATQQDPAAKVSDKQKGNIAIDISNLSAYQSHAIHSRQQKADSNTESHKSGFNRAVTYTASGSVKSEVAPSEPGSTAGKNDIEKQQAKTFSKLRKTNKQVGAPYGVSSLSFRGTSSNQGIAQNNSRLSLSGLNLAQQQMQSVANSHAPQKQIVTSQQNPGFQSQQLKRFAIKESVRLEPILNNRYSKEEERQNAQAQGKAQQKGDNDLSDSLVQTSARRNISQLKKHSKHKGKAGASSMRRNEIISNSLRKARKGASGNHQNTLSVAPLAATAESSTTEVTIMQKKAAHPNNKSVDTADEVTAALMLIKQESGFTTSKQQVSLDHLYGEATPLESQQAKMQIETSLIDFQSQQQVDETTSAFNNSVLTTTVQNPQQQNNRTSLPFATAQSKTQVKSGHFQTPRRRNLQHSTHREDKRSNNQIRASGSRDDIQMIHLSGQEAASMIISQNGGVNKSRKTSKSRRTNAAYEQLPYMKQNQAVKNMQTVDRKRQLLKSTVASTLSPSLTVGLSSQLKSGGAEKNHATTQQNSTGPESRGLKQASKLRLSSQNLESTSQQEPDTNQNAQGSSSHRKMTQKNRLNASSKRHSIGELPDDSILASAAGTNDQKSYSPRLKATYERSFKTKRESDQAPHRDHSIINKKNSFRDRTETSAGLSNSVVSLPRIAHENERDKNGTIGEAYASGSRRIGTHRPSHNKAAVNTKQSLQGSQRSPRGFVTHQQLSQRPGGAQSKFSKPQLQGILSTTPKATSLLTTQTGKAQASQTTFTGNLKKQTKSFSVLKHKKAAQIQVTAFAGSLVSSDASTANQVSRTGALTQLPKLKKQVSIREEDFDSVKGLRSSLAAADEQSPFGQKQFLADQSITSAGAAEGKGVPSINRKRRPVGTPLTTKDDHKGNTSQQVAIKRATVRRANHIKSNSMVNSLASASIQPISESLYSHGAGSESGRALSTSVRHSHNGAGSEFNTLAPLQGDGVDSEHQIRIEISKTEVIDAMKKDHAPDLSLLYYDFNNSKARLMSKMKKMSDYVIQEEVEADGDGHAAQSKEQAKRATDKTSKSSYKKGAEKTGDRINITSVENQDLRSESSDVSAKKKQKALKNTSLGMVEASSAIKQLDLPIAVRMKGVISSHDLTNQSEGQMESEMDFVNRKIDKAKQSISQMQTEGGLKGMGLQSPARLANSRNSSTHTLKQYAANLSAMPGAGGNPEEGKEPNSALVKSIKGSMQGSPAKQSQKQIFLFNLQKEDLSGAQKRTSGALTNLQHKNDLQREEGNQSPCFGSVKNSAAKTELKARQDGRSPSPSLLINTVARENQVPQKSNQRSESLSSVGHVNDGVIAFGTKSVSSMQPSLAHRATLQQNQFGALSGRSGKESSIDRLAANGYTGGTGGGDTESNFAALALQQQQAAHGMGTGYQTSATYDKSSGGQGRQRMTIPAQLTPQNAVINTLTGSVKSKAGSIIGSSSPVPMKNRRSQEHLTGLPLVGFRNDETHAFDNAAANDGQASAQSPNFEGEKGLGEKVKSVVAFVKENKTIWE